MLLVFSFRVGSFGLLCMSFVNVHQFVYVLLSLFYCGILNILVPDHCLSFSFTWLKTLLILGVLFTRDSNVEELFCGATSG